MKFFLQLLEQSEILPRAAFIQRQERRIARVGAGIQPHRAIHMATGHERAEPLANLRLETLEWRGHADVRAEIAVIDRLHLATQTARGRFALGFTESGHAANHNAPISSRTPISDTASFVTPLNGRKEGRNVGVCGASVHRLRGFITPRMTSDIQSGIQSPASIRHPTRRRIAGLRGSPTGLSARRSLCL